MGELAILAPWISSNFFLFLSVYTYGDASFGASMRS